MVKLLDRYFPVEKTKKQKARIQPIRLKQTQPQVSIMTKETEQVQLMLGFPGLPSRHKDLPVLAVLSNILGGTMSSRLFTNLREKRGLCYTIRAGSDSHEDVGSFAIRAGLDKSRVLPALKLIAQELRRLITSPVSLEELKRAKENIRGTTILRLEDASDYLYFLQSQDLMHDSIESVESKLEKIMKVTAADIQRVAAQIIRWNKSNLAIIGPFSDHKPFKDLLTK
jgi:predicted Zn-dependent peptidase